jgi:hypothetical protein
MAYRKGIDDTIERHMRAAEALEAEGITCLEDGDRLDVAV